MNNIKTFENFNNQDIFTYILNNDIKSVKNYIDSGYDLNVQDNNGNTALMWVVINNDNNDTNIKKPKSTNKGDINRPFFTVTILIINPLIKLDIIKNVSTG